MLWTYTQKWFNKEYQKEHNRKSGKTKVETCSFNLFDSKVSNSFYQYDSLLLRSSTLSA